MSNVVRVNIIVEGQTEETFVRDLLQGHLANVGVYAVARCVVTGRKHGKIYRGGMTTYTRARRDIRRWLSEDPSAYLTTMFDLYKLPPDFPNSNQTKTFYAPHERVRRIEAAIATDIQSQRFIPYVQLYEFEGLLFSNVQVIDRILNIHSSSQLAALKEIRTQFRTPEEINDGETTAPSKRLKSLYPGYDKVTYGPRIAQRIGLDTLRQECPHFDDWVSKLETLAGRASSRRTTPNRGAA
ncbi:MAG: DUF4276 family protein [Chloroflexota bacterium]|nr:DUF4276 family protein [Chloroflexota bacterium]